MKNLYVLLTPILVFLAFFATAQSTNTCGPYYTCDDSIPACRLSELNGINFTTPQMNIQGYQWCTSIENISFFKFVAESPSFQMKVTPNDCTGGGVQVGEFPDSCGLSIPFLICQSPGVEQPIFTFLNNLDVGRTYIIAIDGFAGSVCDVSIEILYQGPAPTTISPATTIEGPGVSPPATLCTGYTGTYSTPAIPLAGVYTWTLTPPIGTINIFSTPATSIDIAWTEPGTAQLCVTPSTSGIPIPLPFCRTITVGSEVTSIMEIPLCPGECIFIGDVQYCAPSTFQTILSGASQFGCDSVVISNLTSSASSQSRSTDTLYCENQFLLFNNDTIREQGIYSYILGGSNAEGCDSTVILEVFDSRPQLNFANITTYCEGQTVTLSAGVAPGVQFQWSPSNVFSCDTCATTTLRPFPGQRISLTYSGPNCTIEKRTKFVAECENTYDTITIGSANLRCLQDPAFPRTDWIDICPDQMNSVRFSPINDRCISYFGERVGTDTLCVYARGPNNALTTYRWYITVAEGNGFLSGRPAITKDLSVFPNPTKDIISWKSSRQLSQIQIRNLQGQLLYNEVVMDTFGQVEVAHLPKGVYYLIGQNGTEFLQQLFIIQ